MTSTFLQLIVIFFVALHDSSSSSGTHVRDRLNDPSSLRSLDSFITHLMGCRKIPGFIVSVVGKDHDILKREYGFANIRDSVPMSEHTRVCIASCTKAFTSTLLGLELKDKRYSWNTPVSQILPDCCHFPDKYRTQHVTIGDILSHRTGVEKSYDILWLGSVFNRTELYRRIRLMQAGNSFRAGAIYNNIIYSVAGLITEALAGEGQRSWEELLEMRILRPLGMFNTSFYHRRTAPSQFATPYDPTNGQRELNLNLSRGVEAIAASIALCTTSADIALWMKCLLAGVIDDGCPVVAKELIDRTTVPQVLTGNLFRSYIRRPRTSASLIIDAYAMGWFVGYYRERRIVMHYGSLPGSYSFLALVPDLDLGVFLSYNGAIQLDPFTINAMVLTYIIDLELGVRPWISSNAEACNFPSADHFSAQPPFPKTTDHTPSENSALPYTGLYRHRLFGDASVLYDGSRLIFRYGLIDCDLKSRVNGSLSGQVTFVAVPSQAEWRSVIGWFEVIFSRPQAVSKQTVFHHVTVPFLNELGEETFSRVDQGQVIVSDLSRSSAESLVCLTKRLDHINALSSIFIVFVAIVKASMTPS